MKILVTGATGYIGSCLIPHLKEIPDVEIVSFSRGTGHDITSFEDILSMTKDVDFVFHLAAMSSVQGSEKKPEQAFRINLFGTYNVLEACRRNKVSWLLFPSSVYVYGKLTELPVKEGNQPKPTTVYGHTKLMGEILCDNYRKHFPISTARIFNVYGPRQSGKIVSDFIDKAREGSITIFGDGEQTIDLIHINDIISAFLTAMKNKTNDTFNLGSGEEISLMNLAKTIAELVGKEIEIKHDVSKSRGNPRVLAEIGKVKELLKWEPEYDIRKGIQTML